MEDHTVVLAAAGSEMMDHSEDQAGENRLLNGSEIPIIIPEDGTLAAEFEPRPSCSTSTAVEMDMDMDPPAAASSSDSTTSSSSNQSTPLRRNSNNSSSPGIELPPGILDDDPMEEVISGGITASAASNNDNIDSLLLVDEQKVEDIEKPHINDVLCGRGVTTNRWVGNVNFRAIVGLNKVCDSPTQQCHYYNIKSIVLDA